MTSDSELADQQDTSPRGRTSPDSIACAFISCSPRLNGSFAKGSSATRSCAHVSLDVFSPRTSGYACSESPSGADTGDGGGVSAFFVVRRSGFDSARRSHCVGEVGVDGEGGHSELVHSEDVRM